MSAGHYSRHDSCVHVYVQIYVRMFVATHEDRKVCWTLLHIIADVRQLTSFRYLQPQSHERNAQQNAATSTSWLPCGGTGRLPCDSSPRWTSCNLPPSFSPPIRSIDLSPPLASPYLNASDLACPRQYRLSGQCRSALPSSAHLGILAGSETVLPCDSQSFSSPAPVSFSSPVVTMTHLPPSFSPPIRSCTKHSDRSEAPASPGDASFSSISCDPLGSLFGGPLSDRRSPGSSEHGQGFASLSVFLLQIVIFIFNDGCMMVN